MSDMFSSPIPPDQRPQHIIPPSNPKPSPETKKINNTHIAAPSTQEHSIPISLEHEVDFLHEENAPLTQAAMRIDKQMQQLQRKSKESTEAKKPPELIAGNGDRSRKLQNILDCLKKVGIAAEELNSIANCIDDNHNEFLTSEQPCHVRLKVIDVKSAHSLLYIPTGKSKGLYLLLNALMKESQTADPSQGISLPKSNSASLAIHLDSGELKILLIGKVENFNADIEEIHNRLEAHNCFAPGSIVKFQESKHESKLADISQEHLKSEEKSTKLGIILDYVELGDLLDVLSTATSLPFKEKVRYACEYSEAVAAMHAIGYVHRDLRPEHSLINNDYHVKLTDFAMAIPIGQASSPCMSRGYMAPEVVQQTLLPFGAAVAQTSSDIWSLGCVLSDILLGPSWTNYNDTFGSDGTMGWHGTVLDKEQCSLVKATIFTHKEDSNHPDAIVNQCLDHDPQKRPTAAEVAARLRSYYATL